MTTPIPEGTRCQCRERMCPHNDNQSIRDLRDDWRCRQDAVLIVQVTVKTKAVSVGLRGEHGAPEQDYEYTRKVHMCQPCSDYAERSKATK